MNSEFEFYLCFGQWVYCRRRSERKTHLLRTQSSEVLPLKPGVDQFLAMQASPTATDFFLANFYPPGPFTCIFSKTSPKFFPVLAVANTVSCVDPGQRIKQTILLTTVDAGSRVEWPRNINRLMTVLLCFWVCILKVAVILTFRERLVCSMKHEVYFAVLVSLVE